jgi:hypothetical protein
MEDTNIKEVNWNRIIMFMGIVIILLAQSFIVYKIYDRQDIYDDEPLFYGAKKYGIQSCECFAGQDRMIWFNQTSLKAVTKIENNYFKNFNFSLIKV